MKQAMLLVALTADDTGAYTVTLDPTDVAPEEALQVVAVVTAGGQDYVKCHANHRTSRH